MFPNKLIIQAKQEIADYWKTTAIAGMFTGNDLVLRVSPNSYSHITEGTPISRVKGISSTIVETTSVFLGFRVTVRDGKEDLRLFFADLLEDSISSIPPEPIIILDYHYRRDRADREQGYRQRVGFIESIEEIGGTVTQGVVSCQGTETITGGRYGAGFTLRFTEAVPVAS